MQETIGNQALKAGEWEVKGSVGDLSGLNLSASEQNQIRAMIEAAPAERRCLRGGTPSVGDRFMGGQCTYTRVSDDGGSIDRVATCPRPHRNAVDTVELTGTGSPERYSLRIVTRRASAETGRRISTVTAIEEGRWVGRCRAEQVPE